MNKFKHLLLIGMILNIALALVLSATFGTAGPVFAAGATYYVATTGLDSNPGTQASPWKTIQKAANTVVAGDTVYVRGGVYKEYVNIKTLGTSAKPVMYMAYPGELPIIDTTGLSDPGWGGIVKLYGASYVTVSGFEIRNTPYEMGVCITGATGGYSNIALIGLNIHNVGRSGIYAEMTNNLLIDSCTIDTTNSISPSNEEVSIIATSNFEIKNCLIRNSSTDGLDCKDGCKNGSIHDNEIDGFNRTTTGVYLGTTGSIPQDNFKIYNNKIHDINGPGIVLCAEESPYPAITNVDVFNNLIYNNGGGFAVWPNPFTRNFRIINNVFYNNGDEIAVYGSGSNAGVNSNCIIRNNILAHSGDYMLLFSDYSGSTATIDHNLFYDSTGKYLLDPGMLGTNYVKANPMFVNAAAFDFRLQAGSPAIGAGSATLAPATDFIGTLRPQGAAYDIGAYEYAALNPSPTLTPTPTPTPITGDINGDGVVNSTDLVKLMRILMGLDPVTSSVDVNGDGNIDAHDITPELIIMRGLE